jgi:hypothetical protein
LLFRSFLGQKRNKEQQKGAQDFSDFEHELTPEYIKGKIDKIVSCSSGIDVFCEIFDTDGKSLTVDQLVGKYYPAPAPGISSEDQEQKQKNSENEQPLEEQQKGARIEPR